MKRRSNALLEEKEKKLLGEQNTVIVTATGTAAATDANYANAAAAAAATATATTTATATATTDRIFAKALMHLSLNDRTTIEDEIHGVTCMAVEETPYLLELSLFNFELELEKINPKPAYDKAQQLLLVSSRESSRSYINENKFRLRFLRCELFNVRKAAERFLRYLDFVAEVYGEYALLKPISMSDFSHEEMSFLREGIFQLLPYRDISGRRIYVLVSNTFHNFSKQTFLKINFYLANACTDSWDTTNNDFNNIESLQKGVIIVAYTPPNHVASTKSNLEIDKWKISSNFRIAQAVPVRVVCRHLCYPNTEAYKILGKVVGMTSSVWNSKTKIHLGNPVEWRYALLSYGIPSEIIPFTNTGTVKLDNWKKWIKLKTYTEQQEMTVLMKTSMKTSINMIVECPGSNDVVFRRGTTMNYHPGNVKFQNVIESQLQHHSNPNTTKAQQKAIEFEVIQNVRKVGGRFLKWEGDKGWWIDMSVEMCVDMNSVIDMDISNITTISSIPTGMNTDIDTDTDRNANENTNENVTLNVNGNLNVRLNSNNSASCVKAEKEIQSKVHYAFRDFKKKKIRAQQKQQKLQVNTSSTYVFAQQDGQKRNRCSNNDINITTMESNINSGNNSSMCMPFLSDMNDCTRGYFFSNTNDSSFDNTSTNNYK